jgi:hypothetical protein
MQQFNTLNQQQQPFIQSGYSANNALSYLLGLPGGISVGGSSGSAPAAPAGGGPSRGAASTLGRILSPATAGGGLIDPLGQSIRSITGTSNNARGYLDPLGVFGSGGGDTEAFNKGPRPEGTGDRRFKPSEIVALKNQGMSIDDIMKQGWLSPMEHEHELGYLKEAGLTDEDINRLQTGPGSQAAANGEAGAAGQPTPPISGLDSGYLTHQFNAEDFGNNIDPGYGWRLQQGNQALQNSAAAGSGVLSGAALKDLIGYNQGAASQEYGNAFNRYTTQQNNIFSRLSSLANLGQNAAAGVGQQGTALAGNAGQFLSNAGTAEGAGIVGAGNALSNGASNYWLSKLAGSP